MPCTNACCHRVGYLVQLKGWRAEFYLLAGIHLGLFFLHLFFGPETLYPYRSSPGKANELEKWEATRWYDQYIRFRTYKKEPFHLKEILKPFAMALRPVVMLPAVAYAITFAYTGVLMVCCTIGR